MTTKKTLKNLLSLLLVLNLISGTTWARLAKLGTPAKPARDQSNPRINPLLEDPEEQELRAEKKTRALPGQPAQVLTLKKYLEEVRNYNETVRAAGLTQKSHTLKSLEPEEEFMPAFTADVNKFFSKPYVAFGAPVTVIFDHTDGYQGTFGLSKKWWTGTQTAVSYNAKYSDYFYSPLTSPGFIQDTGLWQAVTSISITQPLVKDFNAHVSRYLEDKVTNLNETAKSLSQFQVQQILAQAEGAYWRLVATRSVTEYKAATLKRTQRLYDWTARRARLNIADRSDLLQAEAALKLRTLELQTAREDQVTAARQFNSLRNIEGDGVPELLEKMSEAQIEAARQVLSRTAVRLDVVAAEKEMLARRAEAREQRERLKPDVSLYGQAQLFGQDTSYNTAQSGAFKTDYNAYQVGLKMTIPLDFGLISDVKQGYNAAAQAAEVQHSRKNFELDQDWRDLKKKFNDAIARLETARELERLQSDKLLYEKVRLDRGRSTNFQVLTFEEDYSSAQLNRLKIEAEVLSLRAQARLFNGETL